MMNDTFQSTAQQISLIEPRRVKRDLKVSFAEFIQLRYVRNDWSVCTQQPHHPNLVSPLWYALFKFLKQRHSGKRILWPNTPKYLIDVTTKSNHLVEWVIKTNIHHKPPV